jgi:hypothetical protein
MRNTQRPANPLSLESLCSGVAVDADGEGDGRAPLLPLGVPVEPAVTAHDPAERDVVEARHDLALGEGVGPEAAARVELLVGDHGDADVEEVVPSRALEARGGPDGVSEDAGGGDPALGGEGAGDRRLGAADVGVGRARVVHEVVADVRLGGVRQAAEEELALAAPALLSPAFELRRVLAEDG